MQASDLGITFFSGQTVSGSDVAVDLALGYPAKSQHEALRKLVTSALSAMPGVGRVSVTIGTRCDSFVGSVT